ncbi:hypothetical protein RCL1_007751 [Eukaryota sp. TZLM3-RCL]
MIRNHLYTSLDIGGVGFSASRYLVKSAILGGGKNFIFEFCHRFPKHRYLISGTISNFLFDLEKEVSSLTPEIWSQCFPSHIREIPSKSLLNLRFCVRKLQHHFSLIFEGLEFKARVGSATLTNPAFANFLHDTRNSSVSCLFSQIPIIYGMLLNEYFEWTTSMRLRCFLWPSSFKGYDLIKGKPKPVAVLNKVYERAQHLFEYMTDNSEVKDKVIEVAES